MKFCLIVFWCIMVCVLMYLIDLLVVMRWNAALNSGTESRSTQNFSSAKDMTAGTNTPAAETIHLSRHTKHTEAVIFNDFNLY